MTDRGLRGRSRARLLLFGAVCLDFLAVLLFVTAPDILGPMFAEPPPRLVWLIPAVGILLNLVGLVWMVGLYPGDAEDRPSAFRFTRR